MIDKIIQWANQNPKISLLIQTGSLAGRGKTDWLSDQDIAVFGESFEFIREDNWLAYIGRPLVCIHDEFNWEAHSIPTRLVIFEGIIKVDFSFFPNRLLYDMIDRQKIPEGFDAGYKILLDKVNVATNLPAPTYQAYKIKKPTSQEFDNAIQEFWFESYHVAKYIYRRDLWTAKSRDWAAKTWILKMMEWNAAAKSDWKLKPGDGGKDLHQWLDQKLESRLHELFSHYDKEDSTKKLLLTTSFFSELSEETAGLLEFEYNRRLEKEISNFITELLSKK